MLDPVNFFDSGFGDREFKAKLSWPVTGKSSLNWLGAYVSREHDHFAARNYAGLGGNASYTWAPSGKTSLTLAASRDLASFQLNDSSFNRNDSLTVAPAYAFSEKLILRASAGLTKRHFLGFGTVASTNRIDTSKFAGLSADWKPLRSVTVGASLQQSNRNSTKSGLDFSDTTIGVSANILF